MFWLIILRLITIGRPEVCQSTIFAYHGDRLAGKVARYLNRPIDPDRDVGVAHRSAPLGTVLLLHLPSTDRWTFAVVIDRGPYGRKRADGSWINGAVEYRRCQREHPEWSPLDRRCYKKGSRWNGCIDLAPATARLLDHDGWERIHVYRTRIRIPSEVLLQLWDRPGEPSV